MALRSVAAIRLPRLLRPVAYVGLLAAVSFSTVLGVNTYHAMARDPEREKQVLLSYGLEQSPAKRLEPQFTDANGDLLADPPSDPAKLVEPAEIALAYVKSDKPDSVAWDLLAKQIETETGRKVTASGFISLRDKFDAIRAGQVQVLVVHAAETPYLVNHYGFIPFGIAADNEGPNGHRLMLLVSAKSSIHTAKDVKTRNLVCTEPLSIVGYRAAVAYLHNSVGLRPEFDYTITFSGGQKESIQGVARGDFELAAISSDKLSSMTAKGSVTADQYRVLYQSEVVPRFAIGYFHNLKPQVAESITRAVMAFVNPPDPTDDDHPARFIPSVYARDFATVRAIDNAFDPRLTSPEKPATSIDEPSVE